MSKNQYRILDFDGCRSYATRERAVYFINKQEKLGSDLRFLIATTPNGRFVPVAIGQDAIQSMLHSVMAVVG